MAKTINPRLDFRGPTALELDRDDYPLGRISHTPIREGHNNLAPAKFNEYERVLVEIADAIGDYGVSDTIPASADNLGAGVRKLYWIKFDKAGGTIEGPTIFSSIATVTFGADLIINSDVTHAGSYDVTGTYTGIDRDFTTVGRITARAFSLEWASTRLYRVSDVVIFDKKIYRCKTQHTSSGDFISDYAANWELAGGGGSTTIDVNTTPDTHTFSVGDVLFYEYNGGANPIGYTLAQADSAYTLGLAIIVASPDNENFTLMTGGYSDILGNFQPVIESTGVSEAFTEDTWYYLSANWPGKITKTKPSIGQPILYTLGDLGGGVEEALIYIGGHAQGSSVLGVEEFTAGAGQTQFTLNQAPVGRDYLFISIDNNTQHDPAFTLNGDIVTFTAPMVGGEEVRFQYVTLISAEPAASMTVDNFIATTDQVDFIMTSLYDPLGKQYLIVSIDGTLQDENAYDLLGKTVTFAYPLLAGTKVRIAAIHNLNIVAPSDGTVTTSTLSSDIVMWKNRQSFPNNITVPNGENRMSVGPIIIEPGVTVELQGTSVWVII